jgi:hypothetical protein
VLANAHLESVSRPSCKLAHDADASPSIGQ